MDRRAGLQSMAEDVTRRGPDRVVVRSSGAATTSRDARERLQINPDVVFIRNDGWTLGAPVEFETVAFRMWSNEWVGFMRKGETEATAIVEYDRA